MSEDTQLQRTSSQFHRSCAFDVCFLWWCQIIIKWAARKQNVKAASWSYKFIIAFCSRFESSYLIHDRPTVYSQSDKPSCTLFSHVVVHVQWKNDSAINVYKDHNETRNLIEESLA